MWVSAKSFCQAKGMPDRVMGHQRESLVHSWDSKQCDLLLQNGEMQEGTPLKASSMAGS